MIDILEKANIGIVGGGRFCKELLDAFFDENLSTKKPNILGVADIDDRAAGFNYARSKGLFTTRDYQELYTLPGLNMIIEITKNGVLFDKINATKPPGVHLLDSFEARTLLDRIRLEAKKNETLAMLKSFQDDITEVEQSFEGYHEFVLAISAERNLYSQAIRKGLLAGEKVLAQIIQGSPIPTFVISKNHVVTHWNKACEKLTGFAADSIIGTDQHWKPFRSKQRPTMADLILDGVSEEEVWRYYRNKWKKSELIEGAYEAEEYFQPPGQEGRWLFFTAAPLKDANGTVVGAIEILQDKSEEKRAQQERERHNTALSQKTKELIASQQVMSQIIQGSTIPTFVIDKTHTISHWNKALQNLTGYAAEEMVGTTRQWEPFWESERPAMADVILDQKSDRQIKELYGTKWRKSDLLEDAYEAEVFFPKLGDAGKWCFFTAAPIKSSEGEIIGAIETLWDKTDEKIIEEERIRQNKRLIESEKTLAQIVQGSTIPTFVIDKEHTVTHWNRACEKLTGYPASEIVGTNQQWKPFRTKERPIMADLILDGARTEEVWRFYGTHWKESELIEGAYEAEEYFEHLGENGKWLYFTAAPLISSDDEIIGAIETIWDRTEEKKAEEELEKHTRELATLCSIYATLSKPLDIEGRIKEALGKVTDIFTFDFICVFTLEQDENFYLKYSHGNLENICIEEKISATDSMVFKIAQTNRFEVFEDLNQIQDEEMILLKQEGLRSLVYIPLMDKEKKAFGVIRAGSRKTRQFTTEDKHVLELFGNRMGVAIENSLLQEEVIQRARFQTKLINSSNNGIIATDENGQVVVFNPEAERLFGYSKAEALGIMKAEDLYPFEVMKSIEEKVEDTLAEQGAYWQETTIHSRDDEIIPVRFSGTPLYRKEQVIGSVAFFQDLREIKRLEKELLHSERLAAIGQTVAGMAHGIKNLLNGFKGGRYLVDIGIDKNNPDKLKNGWQMIKRNIDRTSDLVLDLLSYSKEREPEYRNCFPNDIIADVCEVVQETAATHGIDIVQDLSPAIGEVALDPTTVHRCLLNLATNAIDACILDDTTDKKHRVSVKTTLTDNRYIRFEVTDNGAGMPPEVKAKLFTSFFSTKGPKGTGLGLLVTHKLIEEHHGSIHVVSEPGRGSTFIFKLPFRAAEGGNGKEK